MARAKTGPVSFRERLACLLDSPTIQTAIVVLILINAVIFGLETIPPVAASAGPILYALDYAILAIFVVEISARLFAFGPRFFRDPWAVFDLIVIAIALLPASGSLSALRALRVLRILRLISALPALRSVVDALLRALPAMGSVAALLLLVLYVGAVIATKLFGATHPAWFGDLGNSLLTLFQILTLEGWADIMREVAVTHRFAWLFFVPFVLIATFAVLNLVVAVIVDSMQGGVRNAVAEEEEERDAELRHELSHDIGEALRGVRAEIAELRAELAAGKSPKTKTAGSSGRAKG